MQLLILKNLHSNTLQHLDMVADLFSDSVRMLSEVLVKKISKLRLSNHSTVYFPQDSLKLSEDCKTLSGDIDQEVQAASRSAMKMVL